MGVPWTTLEEWKSSVVLLDKADDDGDDVRCSS